MSVVVRFAPSPTGYLHIGGARTALFNWLFARHHGGRFLLRIEDTDRERSTTAAIDAIFESLRWLGLNWDAEPVFQFTRAERHAEVARKLVEEGRAYYCYCSPQELEAMREAARVKGLPPRYNGYWRDRPASDAPEGVAPVIRFKAPPTGRTSIEDLVQGEVVVDNAQMDDMVLLRADGTPTYMLSVVVDDHDMGITHVIRGDDHLTNAFRQYHLYRACGWEPPHFAHIPLIHGPDGAKLSKRYGAVGADQYKAMGFLPEAMVNYLVRLGWAHGDDEVFTREQATEWFDIGDVGKSPARFDVVKLTNLNGHYLRATPNARLLEELSPFLSPHCIGLTEAEKEAGMVRILSGMDGLKERAKTLVELAEKAAFYLKAPDFDSANAQHTLTDTKGARVHEKATKFLMATHQALGTITPPAEGAVIEQALRTASEAAGAKLGDFIYPLRIALTGAIVSPSIFEIVQVLGLTETSKRIATYVHFLSANAEGR